MAGDSSEEFPSEVFQVASEVGSPILTYANNTWMTAHLPKKIRKTLNHSTIRGKSQENFQGGLYLSII